MGESLYLYAQQYRSVADLLGEEQVEIETVFDTLDAIDEPLKEKVESIGDMIRNLEATEAALKTEAGRLAERATAAAKKKEKLLKYVESAMTAAGFEKIDGLKHTFSFGVSNSLECIDVKKLPRHFLKPQEPKPDIAGLKKDIVKRYDDKGFKLVTKLPKKPKGNEMLYTELNDELAAMGVQFNIKRKLSLKKN